MPSTRQSPFRGPDPAATPDPRLGLRPDRAPLLAAFRRLADLLRDSGVAIAGFTTAEVRERGRRVGFEVESFDRERAILAGVRLAGPPRVGRYGVDLAAFERIALGGCMRPGKVAAAGIRMKYVLSNWKMYVDRSRAGELFGAVQAGLRERFDAAPPPVSVVVCPSFVSLVPLREVMDPRLVRLGAQDCHWEAEGPFTGETSAAMLRDLVDYVLVGHSERRAAGDTDEQVAKKAVAATRAGLTPILFVGEDESSERAFEHTEERLTQGLAEVDPSKDPVLVVYEPTWAIGADDAAGADHVREVVVQLKDRLEKLGASEPCVIYGGTVTADNVEQFAGLDVLDGVGATRAGLDPEGFLRIVDRMAEAESG